jgi:hypothetical protein
LSGFQGIEMSSSKAGEISASIRESRVRELVALIGREMAASSEDELEGFMAEFRQVFNTLVEERDEGSITAAIIRAGELLGPDGSSALRLNIEVLASECTVLTIGDDVLRGGLYALPVQVFAREPGQYVGGAVDSGLFGELAEIFRSSGLLRREARIGFVPYLYQEGELAALSFSEIHHFTGDVVSRVTGAKDWGEGSLMQTAEAERREYPSRYAVSFKLMYLVFGVVDLEKHIPFVKQVDGVVDMDETDKVQAACVAEATPFVRTLFGGESVLVHTGYPRPFCAALREGAQNFRASHFHVLLLDHMKETRTFPQELRAVVTAHGDGDYLSEYRISALNAVTGQLVFGEVYPFFAWEDFDEVEEAIEVYLRHEGFVDVEMPEGLLPDERCTCCGRPVFLDRTHTEEGQLTPVHQTFH